MIFETGTVVSKDQSSLWVETIQRTACDTCIAEKGCGQSLLSKLTGKTNRIRVLPGNHAVESLALGQSVTIGIPEHVIVKGSLLVYLVPILMAVVGAWLLGSEIKTVEQDLLSVLGAAVGLLLGGLLVKFRSNQTNSDPNLNPVLSAISANCSDPISVLSVN
ncbi:MAG: SoxR reducing system RseC family protein [Porticoccaceae bacterium]|tara:strand:- start:19840 stop:20325 length:486 start_codon:yes stop_codon:yes gene_type:complete